MSSHGWHNLIVASGVWATGLAPAARGQFPPVFNLADLDGTNGFALYGVAEPDFTGDAVSAAGDVKADGVAELIVGAPGPLFVDPFPPGYAYVVFGCQGLGGGGALDLLDLDGSNGFVIPGLNMLDSLGVSLSPLSDFNSDGIGDFLVGAYRADPLGRSNAGETYVIYGAEGLGASGTLSPGSLNGTNGFRIAGARPLDGSGFPVGTPPDFNEDGWPDIVLGAAWADPHGSATGQVYVVYGGPGVGSSGLFDLAMLDGTNGLTINGIATDDWAGVCAGLGDFNGDGIDDIGIGAYYASPGGLYRAGQAYVVYGQAQLTQAVLELADLDGTNGFAINGRLWEEKVGIRVSSAGDLNDDGYKDLVISSSNEAGSVYVVFGGPAVGPTGELNLSALDGSNGFRVPYAWVGEPPGVGGIGDLNGDGIDDLAIGDFLGPNSTQRVAVIYGRSNVGQTGVFDINSLDGSNGFIIAGFFAWGRTGSAVAGAGDVNDDGLNDLIIGEPVGAPPGRPSTTGMAYVIFGRDTGDPADFDDDGDVDLNDFIIFQLCFVGSNNPRAPGCARPDLDRDGDVDLADFLIFQQNFTGSE